MNENFQKWVNLALEGKLSDDDKVKFNQALKDDPELKRHYIQQCKVEAYLKEINGGLVEQQGRFKPKVKPNYSLWLSIAATLLIASSLWLYRPIQTVELEELTPGPLARVVVSDQKNYPVGQLLNPGDFELLQGKVHIVMDSGAEIIFKGKVKARLENAMRVHLDYGKVSVEVPPPAQGFKLTTQQLSVNDLGTSFGVDANQEEHEVHVFKGKVTVMPSSIVFDQETEVTEGKAVKVYPQQSSKLKPYSFAAMNFDREFSEPKEIQKPFLHYTFEEDLKDSGTHLLKHTGEFRSRNLKPTNLQSWGKGRFGKGLHLKPGYWVQTPYLGVHGSEPRSISMWIRVLPSQKFTKPASILAWGHGHASEKKWQVMLDGNNGGALRVSLGKGYVVGSTDLQDGHWHHICAVFLGGSGADIRTHLRLYVNGKLETLKKTQLQKVNTASDEMMVIGQNLTFKNDESRIFNGLIDELYIFEEALHPNQIELLGHNQLPQREQL